MAEVLPKLLHTGPLSSFKSSTPLNSLREQSERASSCYAHKVPDSFENGVVESTDTVAPIYLATNARLQTVCLSIMRKVPTIQAPDSHAALCKSSSAQGSWNHWVHLNVPNLNAKVKMTRGSRPNNLLDKGKESRDPKFLSHVLFSYLSVSDHRHIDSF